VQRPELEPARRPGFVSRYSPSPLDFEHPLDYRMLDGEHMFGDAAVVLSPTCGHTSGHQSLVIRTGEGRANGLRRRRLLRAGDHGP
jgi:glyoxylase-like metal-dependent hydrolase (beta-lactamase superfamily II)